MKHTIDELFDTDPALAQWKHNFARADKMRRRRLTWERWRPAVIATVITAAVGFGSILSLPWIIYLLQ